MHVASMLRLVADGGLHLYAQSFQTLQHAGLAAEGLAIAQATPMLLLEKCSCESIAHPLAVVGLELVVQAVVTQYEDHVCLRSIMPRHQSLMIS